MYLVNSYHHVLKNIDSSWGDSTISSNSRSGKRTRRRKIDSSHSFSQSSRRSSQTYASSSESGLYSEELVNSGYYGDDEVDRCSCTKCVSEALAVKPKTDIVADYDIISEDLSESTTPELQLSCVSPIKQSNFDDYVIIPSSKEEFFADALAHSTPISECKLLEEDESDSSLTGTAALQRVTGKNDSTSCWWRENIVWQLQQRNDTQTKRFSQLQTDNQSCRAKVRINRELADYLNKYPDLRPQAETTCNVMVNMEVDPIERSELFLAIRNQRTASDETGEYPRPRSDSIAHLAATYLKRQRTLTERKLTESEGSYSPACVRSRISNRAGRRERVPGKKWRESIVNQLEMRNFLEFKYFTDTLARRTISQLSISENFPHPMKGVDEYDIITDDEVSSLDSRSTLMNSAHSTSHSQGYYSSTFSSRFFSLKRGKRR
ncbi:uncharacterized protein LOC113682230 isoform X2 [Pocillopora damicornis]|uniref:uncharacterized protein LOC113682230 isoform X2 n=1 Tax=Pocillopora damicornis TaxID=46731 RepID=UPI000F550158|nr:uncharacterized protein LOC113682230 isoform X2 [Pocillopora damicornis]